jgi:hypothetical protein
MFLLLAFCHLPVAFCHLPKGTVSQYFFTFGLLSSTCGLLSSTWRDSVAIFFYFWPFVIYPGARDSNFGASLMFRKFNNVSATNGRLSVSLTPAANAWTTGQWHQRDIYRLCKRPEAEFLDVIGAKVFRVFLLAIHSHPYYGFYPPPPLEQKWLETGL